MEPSKSFDQTAIVMPLEDQETKHRRHLRLSTSSSVCFGLVAALFSAACLSIALQNAAEVTTLKERLQRLEERAEYLGGDVLSEQNHHSETENLIKDSDAQSDNMFRHREKRETKEKKKTKKEKNPSVGKAKFPSSIHLSLDVDEMTAEQNQILRSGGVVALGYGDLTSQGFRPKKEHRNGDQTFTYKPWKVANWSLPANDYSFNKNEGKIKIERKGLYFIYSQLLYHNSAARSSYVIMVDKEMYVKCMGSVDSIMSGSHSSDNARYKTCYVGAARVLEKGQHVWINDLYGHYISPDAKSNFFGLIKITDLDK